MLEISTSLRHTIAIPVTLLYLWAASVHADTSQRSSIAQQIAAHLEQQQVEDAYLLAKRHAPEEEGDPEFDFFYGLAAMAAGQPERANFAFERLVVLYPGNDRIRFEYARSLYFVGRHADAERQFRIVLERKPADVAVSDIEPFLTQLATEHELATKRWSGFVAIGTGYDSNINSATGSRRTGLFELPASAVETDSPYLSARTQAAYQWPYSQRNRAYVQLYSEHKHHSENSDYDLDVLQLTGAWVHQRGAAQYQSGVQYQHTWLGGEGYQRSSGPFGQWTQLWSGHLSTSLYAGLFDKHSFRLEELNVLQPLFSAQLQLLAGSFLHQFSLGGGTENPQADGGRHLAKDFRFASYQVLWQAAVAQPFVGVSSFRGRYKDADPAFGERRKDLAYQYSVGVNSLLAEDLSLTLETSYTDNDSNLDLYEFTRWRVEARLQRTF